MIRTEPFLVKFISEKERAVLAGWGKLCPQADIDQATADITDIMGCRSLGQLRCKKKLLKLTTDIKKKTKTLKGTISPVAHARDGARSFESIGLTISSSSGESFSVSIELYMYLSHPCEVCVEIYCRTFLIIHTTFLPSHFSALSLLEPFLCITTWMHNYVD